MTIYLVVFIFQALFFFRPQFGNGRVVFSIPSIITSKTPPCRRWTWHRCMSSLFLCIWWRRGQEVKKSQGHGRTGSWLRDNLCYLLMVRGMPQDDMIQPDVILFNSYYLHTYYIPNTRLYTLCIVKTPKQSMAGVSVSHLKSCFFSLLF